MVEVSLWINEGKNGKYFGGYINKDDYVPKEKRADFDEPKAATPLKAAPKNGNPFDDDIPF